MRRVDWCRMRRMVPKRVEWVEWEVSNGVEWEVSNGVECVEWCRGCRKTRMSRMVSNASNGVEWCRMVSNEKCRMVSNASNECRMVSNASIGVEAVERVEWVEWEVSNVSNEKCRKTILWTKCMIAPSQGKIGFGLLIMLLPICKYLLLNYQIKLIIIETLNDKSHMCEQNASVAML